MVDEEESFVSGFRIFVQSVNSFVPNTEKLIKFTSNHTFFKLSKFCPLFCLFLSIPAILVALPILTYKYTTAWSKKLTAKNNSIQQKNQECFQGTIIWGATILSVLVSPIAAVCGAVIVAPISILYVFCIVPLDLIRNRTLFNQDSLNLVERGLNRINRSGNNKSSSMKSLNEKNSSEDVEAGLQIQEEINDNNNSTKVNEISDTSETDKLVNSNPVQKSVLPPSYSKMLKKLKIWISGIFEIIF